jgi:HNH endonuclease
VPKHQFSLTERYVVFVADGGKCFWCGLPLYYADVQIDHVFPESLLGTEDFEQIKSDYDLGDDYKINGFENWVTCHQGCNLRKRDSLPHNSPKTIFAVGQLKQRASKLEVESKKFATKRRAQGVLGALASAITAGSVKREDVLELIAEPPQVPIGSAEPKVAIRLSKDFELIVPNSPAAFVESQGWTIHSVSGNIAYVNDGRVRGIVPNVAGPHHSWQCSRCGLYGPWDGIICRSCGNREAPD